MVCDSMSGCAALLGDDVLFWVALGVPAGLVMGLLGALAARSSWWSVLVGLAGSAVLVVLAGPTGSDNFQPWPTRVTLGAAIGFAVLIGAVWRGRLYRGSGTGCPVRGPSWQQWGGSS